jgi:predicted acetyltransferase
MPDSETISLQAAEPSDAALLANLLELYIHDLSAAFPHVELGADGRFGYPKLHMYFSEPERRFAFLVRRAEKIAGFILVTRGSPATQDPEVLDIAEFFVLRQHRRCGVGRDAAFLLWKTLPGKWAVRVAEANPDAAVFWRGTISAFTHEAVTESARPGTPSAWRIFSFESKPAQGPGAAPRP